MTRIVALVSALALFLAGFSPAISAAEDPFEKAAKRCQKQEYLKIQCIALHQEKPGVPNVTLGELAQMLRVPLREILTINEWTPGSVTQDTPIPFNSRFAVLRI